MHLHTPTHTDTFDNSVFDLWYPEAAVHVSQPVIVQLP